MARQLVMTGVIHKDCERIHSSIAEANACREAMRQIHADSVERQNIRTHNRQRQLASLQDRATDWLDAFMRPFEVLCVGLFCVVAIDQILRWVTHR